MQVSGRYINLASSAERRAQMEAQLERLGLARRYLRFDAVNGRDIPPEGSTLSPAERGCFMSHYHCIIGGGAPDQHVHVIEDDAVFGPQTAPLLDGIPDEVMDQCDILFTDIFVPLNLNSIFNLMEFYRASGMVEARRAAGPQTRMPRAIMFLNLKPIAFSLAASYVVSRGSRNKLRRLLDEEMSFGIGAPIDITFRKLAEAGKITAFCTMPFLTSVRRDSFQTTTMGERGHDRASELAFFLLRSFFYVGKDDAELMAAADELAKDLPDPGYMDTLLDAFRFIFSERFAQF